jgi:uncharacterized protein
MAGPTWRNEVCARTALQVGLNRPITFASRLACPILMQVGTNDRVALPDAARRTANKAGQWAQLREYPVDHFDVYQGPWQQRALDDQLDFLTRVLDPSRSPVTGDLTRFPGRSGPGRDRAAGLTRPPPMRSSSQFRR